MSRKFKLMLSVVLVMLAAALSLAATGKANLVRHHDATVRWQPVNFNETARGGQPQFTVTLYGDERIVNVEPRGTYARVWIASNG